MAKQPDKSSSVASPDYAAQSPLGRSTVYCSDYDSNLLHSIPREDYRRTIEHYATTIPMCGHDLWNGYELSWLDALGRPQVDTLRLSIPLSSPCIVESKSLKLYLNSFNSYRVESRAALCRQLENDIGQCVGETIAVELLGMLPPVSSAEQLPYELLDDLPLSCDRYQRDNQLLSLSASAPDSGRLLSHLLRSCCPVTGQPDWASIVIDYRGATIDKENLLRYLVSYREHSGFHEQCVEQIYIDLWRRCSPERLIVAAQYTRRGGIDINPFRCSAPLVEPFFRRWRQ